jgi:pimeloyl-ACP methyl ester carboxylesterase
VFVRLFSKVNGNWQSYDYTYHAYLAPVKMTVFLVHGLSQRGAASGVPDPEDNTLSGLRDYLTSSAEPIDTSRFDVDADFDWPCAAQNLLPDCGDHITEGGKALATYIAQKTSSRPTTPIVLVGYSLGGLITRDLMLNNYNNVLTTRRVAAYITLGTPHLGYPYLPIDTLAKPDGPIQDMAGDFRHSSTELWWMWALYLATSFDHPWYFNPYSKDLDGANGQKVATSDYLHDLNTRWTTSSFPGKPTYWMAAAGRSGGPNDCLCYRFEQVDMPGLFVGCPDGNPYNDGVVCDQSARFLGMSGNQPDKSWEDQDRQYHHTGVPTTALAICAGDAPRIPLFKPTGTLLTLIKEVINAAH